MLQKLIVGRHLEFGTFPQNKLGLAMNGVQTMQPNIYHISESEGMKDTVPSQWQKSKSMATNIKEIIGISYKNNITYRQQGSHILESSHKSKGHRNFTWLAYIPGLVTEIKIGSAPVLTGRMSGCWITYYQRNGIRYVGHVGTEDNPQSSNSIAAKNAWNNYCNNNSLQNLTGFNPLGDWSTPIPTLPETPGKTSGETVLYALVTPNGEFYDLWLRKDFSRPNRHLILAMSPHPMSNTLPANGQV